MEEILESNQSVGERNELDNTSIRMRSVDDASHSDQSEPSRTNF